MEDTGIPESGSFGSEDLPKEAPPPQEAPPQQEEEEMGSDQFGLPDEKTSIGCGILGRYPIISLLGFVVTGIVLGIGLSFWRPTTAADMETKAVVLQWINLVGDMFLRYVHCVLLWWWWFVLVLMVIVVLVVVVVDRRRRRRRRILPEEEGRDGKEREREREADRRNCKTEHYQ